MKNRKKLFYLLNQFNSQSSMLLRLLTFSLAIMFLASCKKDKQDTPSYYFSAKIDGVKKEFNTSVVAELNGDNQSVFYLDIIGFGGTSSYPLPVFSLEIADNVPIVAKTYQTIQAQSQWSANGSYTVDGIESYDSDSHDFSITITSLTATEAKGTFSGTIEDRSSGKIIAVTEGSFTAKVN
jgi:hypothetical protein